MTRIGGGHPWWEPPDLQCVPIKVQGITIKPGEVVLVRERSGVSKYTYKGCAYIEKYGIMGYWMDTEPGSGPGGPGPYPMACLMHPNLLEGFTREIDAEE